jgi:hypothetical protein
MDINDIFNKVVLYYDKWIHHKKIKGYTWKVPKKGKKVIRLLKIRGSVIKMLKNLATLNMMSQMEFKFCNNTKERFYIIKVNDDKIIKLFLLYAMFYHIDSNHQDNHNTKYLIGIDYEFNRRNIALAQFSFYPIRNSKYVFICDPNMFDLTQQKILLKTVYISNIERIMHGSDSLDIPYVFANVLQNNANNIILFTSTLYDTRFLCEYSKAYVMHADNKCSIYDALLYFGIISKKKYDELNDINDSMGPVQDVNWNVKKMSSFHLKYASYDVLYLEKFKQNFFTLNHQYNLHIVNDIVRFVYYEKHGVSSIINDIKNTIDKINNYMIHDTHFNLTMNTVYNEVIELLYLDVLSSNVITFAKVNYVKTPLLLVIRCIIYTIILKRYKVYKTKQLLFTDKITFQQYYGELSKLNLPYLLIFLDLVYQNSKTVITEQIYAKLFTLRQQQV